MTSALDGLDTHARAEAIIGPLRVERLERAGLTVVDRNRLKALERLYGACQRQKAADIEFARLAQPGGYMSRSEHMAMKRCDEAEAEIWKIVRELEAMERG
ncbi:hypothetical protein [Alicyclobacillus shizuokensis]|uniref:hypothetical protein n=1 Tax=Alicyclobacillus shizuokensis TaxID=392014 RepID=UPI000836B027|nr:hypothetical protein [Alicyclobacillus shizuokensis]